MGFLAKYRYHLAVEAAGDRGLFARILRYFRAFWFICLIGAMLFLAYGVWVAFTSDLRGGAGMALIAFPAGAFLICALGAAPYGLAQLFLSARPLPEKEHRD